MQTEEHVALKLHSNVVRFVAMQSCADAYPLNSKCVLSLAVKMCFELKVKHDMQLHDMARRRLQVIKCWRRHLNDKKATDLLQQYGVPGLLMSGGVILGKLTQLGNPTDLHIQLEVMLCCLTGCATNNTLYHGESNILAQRPILNVDERQLPCQHVDDLKA